MKNKNTFQYPCTRLYAGIILFTGILKIKNTNNKGKTIVRKDENEQINV